MTLAAVTLDDKYERDEGPIYLSGTQALVRLPMLQITRDAREGLKTACFISGYRGSPMHNVDRELWRAGRFLAGRDIHFQPAVNEDLAATAIWGSQLSCVFPDARFDGVFGIWYGKGPGLDRSIDALRHANLAGTSRYGGVLAMVGDDHGMASTDVPATSEPTFIDLMMPMLCPGSVAELIELGLYGFALSRFCGAWVGFKGLSDTIDTVSTVHMTRDRPEIVLPDDFAFPPGGVHIREPDLWLEHERRLRRFKIPAAMAFGAANGLNRVTVESPRRRFGIVASGKAYFDTLQALEDLGIGVAGAADIGITVLKIAMPHPLDRNLLRRFGDGLEEVLVVEEKRRIIELATKDALYALSDARRPRVVGRYDENGKSLLSELGEIGPDDIARALAVRIASFHDTESVRERIALLDAESTSRSARNALEVIRTPYFCSGCPHNTSTRVPDGSFALGGVGCHFMATYMDRDNLTHTQMGGEGATWIGVAPFIERGHVFQNIGDGTYFHSGLLAIRACVAAEINITYKILFNDAVAMTGGQPVDGPLSPAMISRQIHAEGVMDIVVVSDPLEDIGTRREYAPGTRFESRDALDRLQRDLRERKGVSAIIYVQTCAAEKRRRRKRKEMPDPPRRVFINHRVCEGCGDCNARSNCLSVVPLDTEFGRKRRIDQSACNKDYRCLEGFCPSFVSVVGGRPRKRAVGGDVPEPLRMLPEPERARLPQGGSYNVLVTGIGGTGVVTVGAMLTMAAHLEGWACSSVDQFGMAQKGGAVTSHVRLARRPEDIRSVRLQGASADLVLGCDSLVAGGDAALATIRRGHTRVVVNTHESITGQFARQPDLRFPSASLNERLAAAAGARDVDSIDATRLATALVGDSIATNLFLLGYAYQKGLVPVTAAGIERAIELNGVAVESNKATFAWGRRAAHDLDAVRRLAGPQGTAANEPLSTDLAQMIEHRASDLTDYQNAAYAARYRSLVDRVVEAERQRAPGLAGLGEAVARYAYKLMAYKDEYEVARLYTDGAFSSALGAAFEGEYRIEFHLAPPLLAPRDKETSLLTKRRYGRWMLSAMRLLAKCRGLRGTAFDPFGHAAERRGERKLIADYEAVMSELIERLGHENHALAVEIASLPEQIRGYGHVKACHRETVETRRAELLATWRGAHELRKAG